MADGQTPSSSGDDSRAAINKATTDFLSVIAHKVHTPITAVLWILEALQAENLTEDQQSLVRDAIQSAGQLNDLSRAMLYVFELEKDLSIKPKDVDLLALVKKAVAHLRKLQETRRVRVETKCDASTVMVRVDPELAYLTLRALIDNAVQYSPEDEVVTVHVEQSDTGTQVQVQDHGCGIPVDYKEMVFTKFFRAPNAKKIWTDGAGLDLYMAKSIAKRTGGDISFTSQENKGSTFTWIIPAFKAGRQPWEKRE